MQNTVEQHIITITIEFISQVKKAQNSIQRNYRSLNSNNQYYI